MTSPGQIPYRPEAYWTERLSGRLDLDAVGYRGLGLGLNTWMYLLRRAAVRRALHRQGISLQGAAVAELGVGTGFWVDEWHRSGASRILGADITASSIQALKQRYPQHSFVRCDVGSPDLLAVASGRQFDLVVAMEVLLHITAAEQFRGALDNLRDLTKPGGYALLSDLFLCTEVRAHHQISRTLTDYEREMGRRGFRLVARAPVLFSLHPSSFTRHGARKYLAALRWRVVGMSMRRMPALGWLLGAPMYIWDLACQHVRREGPSTHLTIWKRDEDLAGGDSNQ